MLGNKIEMEITELVEKNSSLLRLGLHLEFNDARHRVAAHLQRNIDRSKYSVRLAAATHNQNFKFSENHRWITIILFPFYKTPISLCRTVKISCFNHFHVISR